MTRDPIPSDFRIHAANLVVGMKEYRLVAKSEDRRPGQLAAEIIAEAAPLAAWLEHGARPTGGAS